MASASLGRGARPGDVAALCSVAVSVAVRAWALRDLIRRTSSISTLIATAMPSASSSPAHGLSSKAFPPSRPMKNE